MWFSMRFLHFCPRATRKPQSGSSGPKPKVYQRRFKGRRVSQL
jgi:hypothetical protein